jgi:hypothetical protein
MIYDMKERLEATLDTPEMLNTIMHLVGIGTAPLWAQKNDADVPTMRPTIYWVFECRDASIHVTLGRYTLRSQDTGLIGRPDVPIGSFTITELPGNGDVFMPIHVHIDKRFRGYGLGKLLNGIRIDVARKVDASAMLCSVRADNEIERKILFAQGWKQSGEFKHKTQHHTVEIWIRQL